MGLEKFGIRALVALVFGPLIILTAWAGNLYFLALIGVLAVAGQIEFYDLVSRKQASPNKIIGVAAGIGVLLTLYFLGLAQTLICLTFSFLLIMIIQLFSQKPGPVLNIAATFMGIIYVAFFLGFLILIREFSATATGDFPGGGVIILIFLSIWICDSAAYILGSRFGRHKLFERVSPNKTIEGTVFGFLFAILIAYLCYFFFLEDLGLVHALALGAICGSFGQLSDLIESLFKRDAQIKDSSGIIPGHGGILDRFDSQILVAPVVYFYLLYFVS